MLGVCVLTGGWGVFGNVCGVIDSDPWVGRLVSQSRGELTRVIRSSHMKQLTVMMKYDLTEPMRCLT